MRIGSADKKRRHEGALLANIAILGIAVLVYAALASPAAVTAMAQSPGFPVYRCNAPGQVSLQCAVSWEASAVEPMLDILSREGVALTFAVSGEWAKANPRLILRMQNEGHEVAVMGFAPYEEGGAGFLLRDLQAAVDAVQDITGESPSTYYCGSRDAAASAAAGKKLGLDTVLCTADLDCAGADAELILKRLAACAGEGSIIGVQPTQSMLEALPEIVNYLKNMGLAIVPTHKMLYN